MREEIANPYSIELCSLKQRSKRETFSLFKETLFKKSRRPLFDKIVKGCLKLQMVQFIFACSLHPELRWLAQGQDGITLAKENECGPTILC